MNKHWFCHIGLLSTRIVTCVAFLCISFVSSAHQIHSATSTVLFNEHTNSIEVIHRFDLHDVEHAVKLLFNDNSDVINDPHTQENFVHYVANKFVLGDKHGKPFELSTEGYEMTGEHFVIYQKMAHPDDLSAISVQHGSLRDVWSQQKNKVNIDRNGDLKSHIFDGTLAQAVVHF